MNIQQIIQAIYWTPIYIVTGALIGFFWLICVYFSWLIFKHIHKIIYEAIKGVLEK